MSEKPMTHKEAAETFRAIVLRYGLRWNASVPRSAYDKLAECNRILTSRERRMALGLSP